MTEKRNTQYQKVFSIFENSKASIATVTSQSKAMKRKVPCQDVTSSVTNACDVPEVITIPESPCPSPVCIPESDDERCSSPLLCQGDANTKLSLGEKENESGMKVNSPILICSCRVKKTPVGLKISPVFITLSYLYICQPTVTFGSMSLKPRNLPMLIRLMG